MHTAQIDPNGFDVELDGKPAGLLDLFPDWGVHDRLAVVLAEEYAGLGASLIIQAGIVSFFEAKPERRTTAPAYAETFLFHAGGKFGDHSAMDVFPIRKEVFLPPNDPYALLAAINDRAITRLVVPEGALGDDAILEAVAPTTWTDRASARDRLISCFEYSPSGKVANPDVVLRGHDAQLESNAAWILTMPDTIPGTEAYYRQPEYLAKLGHSVPEDASRWADTARTRQFEVPDEIRARVAAEHQVIDGKSAFTEQTYRRVSTDDALRRLATVY
ncbi:hypothetical protein [Rhodococcus jostii]|uniref:hypothetical protein n=1 Tax=Rhodococcus TaxID=1827 RepID=UPI003630637E